MFFVFYDIICFTLHTEYWTDYKNPYSGETLYSPLEYSTQQDYCTISGSSGIPDEEGNTDISGSTSTTVIERTIETLDENELNEFVEKEVEGLEAFLEQGKENHIQKRTRQKYRIYSKPSVNNPENIKSLNFNRLTTYIGVFLF